MDAEREFRISLDLSAMRKVARDTGDYVQMVIIYQNCNCDVDKTIDEYMNQLKRKDLNKLLMREQRKGK